MITAQRSTGTALNKQLLNTVNKYLYTVHHNVNVNIHSTRYGNLVTFVGTARPAGDYCKPKSGQQQIINFRPNFGPPYNF